MQPDNLLMLPQVESAIDNSEELSDGQILIDVSDEEYEEEKLPFPEPQIRERLSA